MIEPIDVFYGWMKRTHPNITLTLWQDVFCRWYFGSGAYMDASLGLKLLDQELKDSGHHQGIGMFKQRGIGKTVLAQWLGEFSMHEARHSVEDLLTNGEAYLSEAQATETDPSHPA